MLLHIHRFQFQQDPQYFFSKLFSHLLVSSSPFYYSSKHLTLFSSSLTTLSLHVQLNCFCSQKKIKSIRPVIKSHNVLFLPVHILISVSPPFIPSCPVVMVSPFVVTEQALIYYGIISARHLMVLPSDLTPCPFILL